VFLELLANRLAESREREQSKEKVKAKPADVSPVSQPEAGLNKHLSLGVSHSLSEGNPTSHHVTEQTGCPCPEFRRLRLILIALISLTSLVALINLFVWFK